ncbi:MAG: cysteine-rich KTR domain-containing protein [Eubacterium sp.]|nr:cysteine-rich KTR domain-containing protein [Eubacterium sp.]
MFYPICRTKTRLQIGKDTELKNFPFYCPKCRQKTLMEVKNLQITMIKENEVKM